MRTFKNLPLRSKLRLIILLTSGIVLFLASTAFVTNDLLTFRRSMVTELFILADLLGLNSTSGLLFNETSGVEEDIQALKANPHIILAHIFDKRGKVFVTYSRLLATTSTSLPSPAPTLAEYYFKNSTVQGTKTVHDNYFFHHDYVEIFNNIIDSKKHKIIGTVYIQSDLEAFNKRLGWAGTIMAVVMLISLVLTFLLASRFQRVITQPIDNLLKIMQEVTDHQNYSIRARSYTEDELGSLIKGFNNMLTQIERRDRELNMYHHHLEEMVDLRTQELTQSTVELAEARDQAMMANKAKSTFLANMSHELRTPLNGILGYTQIFNRDKSLTPQQREGLKIIQRSGEYLLTLISDILDLSKIEAGKIELYPATFHFGQFLSSIAELFQMRASQKEITFDYEFAHDLPEGIIADEKRLRQILINLLSNAVKFTKTGGKVKIKVSHQEGKILFKVEDTGVGIATDELKKIFLPFQQAGDLKYRAEGTGLGLAITKTLVEMMGGELQVDSSLGQGSSFWTSLDLPAATGVTAKLTTESMIIGYQLDSQLATGESVNLKVKILVVDDKWENRLVLASLLTPLGFEVAEASDGQEGIDKARTFKPDLIVMDLMMPGVDGLEATRQIRQLPELANVVIIAASASVFEHHRQESITAGCNEFINKPVRLEELFNCLQKYFHLTWLYEQPTTTPITTATPATVAPQWIIPPLETVQELHNLAMMGDVNSILEQLEQLEPQVELLPFVQKLRELAERFDIAKLQEVTAEALDTKK